MMTAVKGVSFLDCGLAARAFEGEASSGDAYVLCPSRAGALLAVVDGLGHGEEAASAAQRASTVISEHPDDSVLSLVRRCHQALVGTRGVAMSVASFDARDDTISWLAVGNVEAVLLRSEAGAAPPREQIVMRGGVVGARLPLLRASIMTVVSGDVLIIATDGIRPGFAERLDVTQPSQQLADQILAGYGRSDDDALVLVARYLSQQRPAA
jgi:serine phosphatase RsbU (regulator of sigma subunit)